MGLLETWFPFYWLTADILVSTFQGANTFLGLSQEDLTSLLEYDFIYQINHEKYHVGLINMRPMKWLVLRVTF